MAQARPPSVRVPLRGLPAVLAALAVTAGCAAGGGADPARPADPMAAAAGTTSSLGTTDDPTEPSADAAPETTAGRQVPDTTVDGLPEARADAAPPTTSSGPPPDQVPDTARRTAGGEPPPDTTADAAPAATSDAPPSDGPAEAAPQTTAGQPPSDDTAEAAATSPAVDSAAVLATLDAAASIADGTIAAVVLDDTGEELVVTPDADEPRYTASLVKLLVVQQLLARDADGEISLSANDRDLMRRALTVSDDRAMSLLWDRWGGAELVTTAAAQFGLTGTRLPSEPGQWGEAVTTARDQATFLTDLGSQLEPQQLATMTSWLQGATDRAADGFAQDFGLLSRTAGAADPVAAKQGWMCCVDSRRQLHSVGVLADGRVAVLLGDFPTGTSWSEARAALDSVAQAVVAGT
ncbi:serine hydrolase [Modestobacter sp. VKM Ac-2984]|uniref:serine hydrolase n=1 Tax=Modestobacter sp. VKM Ac-2984 TaxID=3004138 RepID=UPI0022AA7D9D|nr:serine hydrolase [Modestobacter sp. VKM Ac-2984]MCZ2816278.1 serine hydrolase [Modestobacter sp. VKM Ac-2984]